MNALSGFVKSISGLEEEDPDFRLFEQPLVHAVSAEDGQRIVSRPFMHVCKPGSHGAIWKHAHDKGVFQGFHKHGTDGRKDATVRKVRFFASIHWTLIMLMIFQRGKTSGIVNCILVLKSFSEWKQAGSIGVWKFGGNSKPMASAKQFVRKNSEPFTNSLSRTSSLNENSQMV